MAVVDAVDRADDLVGFRIFHHQNGDRLGGALGPEEFRRNLHHAARLVDDVDGLGILLDGKSTDVEALVNAPCGPVGGEIDPVKV